MPSFSSVSYTACSVPSARHTRQVMCCYAVVGVNLFATVSLQEELSVHSNFQTFPQALLTLFR